jgi:hypothetical protein
MSNLFKWLAGYRNIFFAYGTTTMYGSKYYKCIMFHDGSWVKINFGAEEVENSKNAIQPWGMATHELLRKIFFWKWDDE